MTKKGFVYLFGQLSFVQFYVQRQTGRCIIHKFRIEAGHGKGEKSNTFRITVKINITDASSSLYAIGLVYHSNHNLRIPHDAGKAL
jgi:hypothetical protein